VELRKLKHICVLARAGSYVKAAEELHITQSALSRSVQSLEDQLQLRIFDRGRAGVHVTAAGRLLIERAERILFEARSLQHDLGLMGKGEFGSVAFGLGPLPASIFLVRLLADIARKQNHLQVSVEINNAPALLESLDAEHIEFCICSVGHVSISDKVSMTPLATLPLSLYVRAGHPLAVSTPSPREILKYPLLSGNMPRQSSATLKSAAGLRPGEALPPLVTCDDFLALKSAALQSDAVLMASYATVAAELEAGSLVELSQNPFSKTDSTQLKIISLAGRTLSPGARYFIEQMVEHCREHAEMLGGRKSRAARGVNKRSGRKN